MSTTNAESYVNHSPPATEIIAGASNPKSYVDHFAPAGWNAVITPKSYVDHFPPASWRPS